MFILIYNCFPYTRLFWRREMNGSANVHRGKHEDLSDEYSRGDGKDEKKRGNRMIHGVQKLQVRILPLMIMAISCTWLASSMASTINKSSYTRNKKAEIISSTGPPPFRDCPVFLPDFLGGIRRPNGFFMQTTPPY
ncbi:hypothetical protein M6B38_231950 [Iris pallida]|uniref:Transmembrane protein n=1 Tax=Iris pallida TaxID=29817 RepID=A0AAX6DRA0_IRIPA|nr:hypothetical protein M6B38_231950 [Iris pallida]